METIAIRPAEEADTALILRFIHKIAAYERLEDQVAATEEMLRDALFVKEAAWVLLAENNGFPVGFALYFENFSTFTGKIGIHLEDIFVDEQYRGRGVGKALFRAVAAEAAKRGCARMEWTCLNWNRSAAAFYEAMGAEPMDEWTTFRLSGNLLRRIAEEA